MLIDKAIDGNQSIFSHGRTQFVEKGCRYAVKAQPGDSARSAAHELVELLPFVGDSRLRNFGIGISNVLETLPLPVQNPGPKDDRREQLERKTGDETEGQEQDEASRRPPPMPRRKRRVIESRGRRWIDWRVHAQIFSRLKWFRQAPVI